MPETILSQTSENIQKLFDLSTRIDERIKAVHDNQVKVDKRIDDIIDQQVILMQKIAVLESKGNNRLLATTIEECKESLSDIDKRLTLVEGAYIRYNDRWKTVA